MAGFRFTAQDPVNNDADKPDVAINYNLNLDGGHRVTLTASGREIENGDFVVGGAIGSKFMIGPHSFNLNAHYGEGLGMDGKGRWIDDVFVKRLWRSVKYEEVYLNAYDDATTARRSLGRYFTFYNTERKRSLTT